MHPALDLCASVGLWGQSVHCPAPPSTGPEEWMRWYSRVKMCLLGPNFKLITWCRGLEDNYGESSGLQLYLNPTFKCTIILGLWNPATRGHNNYDWINNSHHWPRILRWGSFLAWWGDWKPDSWCCHLEVKSLQHPAGQIRNTHNKERQTMNHVLSQLNMSLDHFASCWFELI